MRMESMIYGFFSGLLNNELLFLSTVSMALILTESLRQHITIRLDRWISDQKKR
jgi:hypothetical protein